MHDGCVWAPFRLLHALYATSASVWRLSKYHGKSAMNAYSLALASAWVNSGNAAHQSKSAGAVPRRSHSAQNSGIVFGKLQSSMCTSVNPPAIMEVSTSWAEPVCTGTCSREDRPPTSSTFTPPLKACHARRTQTLRTNRGQRASRWRQ